MQCSIVACYKSGSSRTQELGEDGRATGNVGWSWKIGTRITPGSWLVVISCGGEVSSTEVVVP